LLVSFRRACGRRVDGNLIYMLDFYAVNIQVVKYDMQQIGERV